MKNIKLWFQNKFVPTVSKLGNQRHLAAIRDAFAIFTPIIIVGSLAVLWRSVIFTTAGGNGTLPGLFLTFNDGHLTDPLKSDPFSNPYNNFLSIMNYWMIFVQTGTVNLMSIYIVFGLGYFLSMSRGSNAPVIAGLTSLACFFAVTNIMDVTQPWDAGGVTWEGGMYWLGARGLISGIIIGLASGELFSWLSKGDKMGIKMPAGVPPAVSRAFAKLFPVIITIAAAALLNMVVWLPFHFTETVLKEGTQTQFTIAAKNYDVEHVKAIHGLGVSFTDLGFKDEAEYNTFIAGAGQHLIQSANGKPLVVPTSDGNAIGQMLKVFANDPAGTLVRDTVTMPVHGGVTFTSLIYCGVVAPFIGLADNTAFALGIAFLYVILVSFFWFFGLHGTNIVNGAFNPIWLILYAENVAGAHHVFVQGTFDAYIFIGGWGASLALTVATLIFGKKGTPEYEISKFAVAPAVFNINEPITFGYPLVLNAMLAIPLFLVCPILVFTTYAGIEWFNIPPVTALIPWTTPVGFGGLIASGSPWGFVLAIVNFAIATMIWTPFVLLMKKVDHDKLQQAAKETEEGKKVEAKKAAAEAAKVEPVKA